MCFRIEAANAYILHLLTSKWRCNQKYNYGKAEQKKKYFIQFELADLPPLQRPFKLTAAIFFLLSFRWAESWKPVDFFVRKNGQQMNKLRLISKS